MQLMFTSGTLRIVTDGTASSFSVSVSDAFTLTLGLDAFAGLVPVDAVVPTFDLTPPTGPSISGQLSLNSKGTIVTATFATPPPALPAGQNYIATIVVFRNI